MWKLFSACGSTRRAEDNEKSAVLGFRTIVLAYCSFGIIPCQLHAVYQVERGPLPSLCIPTASWFYKLNNYSRSDNQVPCHVAN